MSAVDVERIAEALPGAHVRTGDALDGYSVCGLRPRVSVQVRSTEDVASLLGLAAANGWSVLPRGGGTMLDLGNPPRSFDVALDLSRLNAVVDYQPDDLTLTVQAGVTIAEVERLLAERGQSLPLDAPLPERATVGGVLATNASGPRRTRYGTARDLCIGTQVALADGTLARSGGKVVKNVAGYDLNKLHVGALGTVGAITEATFKLWPAPEASSAVVAAFDSLDDAHATAMQLLNGRLFPAAVELAGPQAAQRLLVNLQVACSPDQWLLAALLAGVPHAVERQVTDVRDLCARSGSAVTGRLDGESRDALFAALRDFGRSDENPALLVLRAAVLPSQTARAARLLESLGPSLSAAPELVCRPSAGLAFGFWWELPGADIMSGVANIRRELAALSGTLIVERTPVGPLAGIDVWGIDDSDLRLMRRLKETYDPSGILNPGRFVAGL